MLKKIIKYVLNSMHQFADDTNGWNFEYDDSIDMFTGNVGIIVPDFGKVFNIKAQINNKNNKILFSLHASWNDDSIISEDIVTIHDEDLIDDECEEMGESNLQVDISDVIFKFIMEMKENKTSKIILDYAYYRSEHNSLLRIESLISKLNKVVPKNLRVNNIDSYEKVLKKLIPYFEDLNNKPMK